MKINKKFPIIFMLSFLIYIFNRFFSPQIVTLAAKETCSFKTGSLFEIHVENSGVDHLQIQREENKTLLIPKEKGLVKAELTLLGAMKLKEIQVNVVDEEKLLAMGSAVGLRLFLEGILVEALTGIEGIDGQKINPLKDLGIKKGDIILEADDELMRKSEDLINKINKTQGKSLSLKIKRNQEEFLVNVLPVRGKDKKLHLGIWVRDTINGIGTLTFCDEKTLAFGALGHGISDEGENHLFPINGGAAFDTEIASIKKGIKGVPGELKGNMLMNYKVVGAISLNTNYGIFGYLDKNYVESEKKFLLPIGYKEYVKEGKASILSNIEKNETEEFEIEIQKIITKPFGAPQGMIVKMTDKRLIDMTGGIVQGMSGSPIIQNKHIIGAVTHVLINDPLRGYGVFIENMFNKENFPSREKM